MSKFNLIVMSKFNLIVLNMFSLQLDVIRVENHFFTRASFWYDYYGEVILLVGELAESKQTEITIKDVDEMALQTLIGSKV